MPGRLREAFPAPILPGLSQTGVNAKAFGGLRESLIACPQKGGRIDKHRGYLGMHPSDQCRGCTNGETQSPAAPRSDAPLALVAKGPAVQESWCDFEAIPGKFRNDERVDHNLPLVQMLAHFCVFRTEVVDPDRGICENQFGRPNNNAG
jgi:hypothetical protein